VNVNDPTIQLWAGIIGSAILIVVNQYRERKAAEKSAKENTEKLEKAAKENAEKAEQSITATAETAAKALSEAILAVAKVQQFGADIDVIRKMVDGDRAERQAELKAAKDKAAELEAENTNLEKLLAKYSPKPKAAGGAAPPKP
jgi:acyl carrier protein phosphodiesterase